MILTKIFLRSILISIFLLNSVSATAADSSLAEATRSCFVSTCGADYVFKHPFDRSWRTQVVTQSLTDKTLKRPLQLMMGRVIHQAVVSDGIYQKLLKTKLAPLEGPGKGFILSMYHIQKFSIYMSGVIADKDGKLTFDREKLKALPEKLSDAEISAISSLKELASFFKGQSVFTMGLSYRHLLKYLYPGKSLTEALKLEAQAVLDGVKVIGQLMPLFKVFSEYNLVIPRALAGSALSEAEMTHMQGQTIARKAYSILLQPSVQEEFQKLPFNPEEMMQKIYPTYQASKKAAAVKNPKTVKNILQNAVADCSTSLSYAYAALPSQPQIDTFNRVLQQIKTTAQQMIEEKTKTTLGGNFNIEITVPTPQEKVMSGWVDYLNLVRLETEKKIKTQASLDLLEPSVQATAMIMMLSDSNGDFFESVSSFCHQSTPPFLDDALFTMDNSIQLSWPTVVHPEVGAAIIAHEVGHFVQNKWPSTTAAENICLMTKQGTSQYVSEDFADLFSAELMRRLGGSINDIQTKNIGCGLVQPEGDRSLLTVPNSSPKDPHSSALYRLLSTGAVQNNTTKECSAFLNETKETRFDQYCRWGQ